ncbi:MAG: hypothetical protein KQJ78_19105 [Deltaproteobacteria bacterium]|nr:hypothetical protein [Deltaproteobacteria bacterium]
MNAARQYLACPRRTGRHRVPPEVCRECRHNPRCPAWQEYRQPSLFPGWARDPREQG